VSYRKPLIAALVGALAIAIATLLLIFFVVDDDDENHNNGTASPSPSASFVTRTGRATPSPTARPAGEENPLNVPEGGGVVALAAGNYRTARFQPQAHFSLGEGWSASDDSPRFVRLFRGNDPAANCVCFINPDGVIDASGSTQTAPATVDEMIDWLTGNPRLDTSNPSSLQVGGLSGRQLDVEVAATAGDEVTYLSAGDRQFAVKHTERQHLTVLEYRGKPLIIAQTSPADEYDDFFKFVEQVVGGLTFG
jgi:hypothetical protein